MITFVNFAACKECVKLERDSTRRNLTADGLCFAHATGSEVKPRSNIVWASWDDTKW